MMIVMMNERGRIGLLELEECLHFFSIYPLFFSTAFYLPLEDRDIVPLKKCVSAWNFPSFLE
jgi:hypothetical protein